MKGLVIAVQFLTRLPTPRIAVTEAEFADSIRWFPAVGLIVGAMVAAAGWAGGQVDPWLGALAALVAWVGVTGALHLDGLGDIADALGAAHKSRERMLGVLADPHVGSFAVVAIALQLAVKLVLLRLALERQLLVVLLLVPFAARIGPLLWTRVLPPLHEGLGARFRAVPLGGPLAFWAIALVGAAWCASALVAAPLLMIGWALWIGRRLGGISGDGHGAGIELVEAGLLLAAVLWTRLA